MSRTKAMSSAVNETPQGTVPTQNRAIWRRLLVLMFYGFGAPTWAGAVPTAEVTPMQYEQHDMELVQMPMSGLLGDYPIRREASGTSWQPEATPMAGLHFMGKDWMGMIHAYVNGVYSDAGGPRGDTDMYSQSMFMIMGERAAGPGKLGIRAMLSADALLIGKQGYPLLFQTGETADGRTPLIDRQHPHDLFMELSTSYSLPLAPQTSVFVYAGLPGEPALGPPTYMHRFSANENPEAPLLHHWLDSTHVAFGVVTLGYINRELKFEISSFRGREPDENRYDIETGPLDSWSVRVSYNWSVNWAMQGSFGRIHSPEQLEPEIDVDRTTFSLAFNRALAQGTWQTMLAWGRNQSTQRQSTSGFLLESTATLNEWDTLFARAETVQKDELFLPGQPLYGRLFRITKVGVGYIRDFYVHNSLKVGVGISGSKHFIPSALEGVYGIDPATYSLFLRARI